MSADNPQPRDMIVTNKDQAYVIGVFLGDGSIDKSTRTFCLQAIDEDFVKKCKASLDRILEKENTLVEMNRLTSAGRIVYAVYAHKASFCRELQEITQNRTSLPEGFDEWEIPLQKELISGLLDSEGYVSNTKGHEYNGRKIYSTVIGIGACDKWLLQLHSFLLSRSVQVGKITVENLPSGKVFNRFAFNNKSFIEHELYFNIVRKQKRVEAYRNEFPGSTTTRGIPKTNETKEKMSAFAKTRKRVGGRFVTVMI